MTYSLVILVYSCPRSDGRYTIIYWKKDCKGARVSPFEVTGNIWPSLLRGLTDKGNLDATYERAGLMCHNKDLCSQQTDVQVVICEDSNGQYQAVEGGLNTELMGIVTQLSYK